MSNKIVTRSVFINPIIARSKNEATRSRRDSGQSVPNSPFKLVTYSDVYTLLTLTYVDVFHR